MSRTALLICLGLVGSTLAPTAALAWDPFRTRNDAVEDGNERMADDDHTGALASYDRAARQLPDEPRVQLNRGLALMAQGSLPEAREALLRAADPDAPADVRADAYYDLGLAFYREGDAAANEEDHQNAQASFREAADAFRRSLRARPGNRDAAWNLELALRRIREEEEKQEEQERQEQEEQEQQEQQDQEQQDQEQQQQDQEQQGDQQQNQDQQGDQGEDQEPGEQGEDQQESQDQQEGDSEEQEGQEGEDGQEPEEQQGQGDESQDQADQNQGEQDQGQQNGEGGEQPQDEGGAGQRLPGHVERVLDALEDDEESLQRARARARAARENRRVTMDW